jgi:hypothetical protein
MRELILSVGFLSYMIAMVFLAREIWRDARGRRNKTDDFTHLLVQRDFAAFDRAHLAWLRETRKEAFRAYYQYGLLALGTTCIMLGNQLSWVTPLFVLLLASQFHGIRTTRKRVAHWDSRITETEDLIVAGYPLQEEIDKLLRGGEEPPGAASRP